MQKITTDILKAVIKKRPSQSYKGTFGKVLIIAGDSQYGGAAMMAASACVYAGAGLVTLATDSTNFTSLRTRLPEAMAIDLHDSAKISQMAKSVNVIAVGPGLEISDYNKQILQNLIRQSQDTQTLVLDATVFSLLGKNDLQNCLAHIILTPHEIEWQRWSGLDVAQQTISNNQTQLNSLTPADAALFLKGAPSHIYYSQNHEVYENTQGTPAMATGGTGDTLTGMMAAFVAQFGFNKNTVAAAGFAHSYLATELARNNYVVLPTMIIEHLPIFMKSWEN